MRCRRVKRQERMDYLYREEREDSKEREELLGCSCLHKEF